MAPPLQICLFDDRRGDAEGEEADKVLGFYPAQVSAQAQTALVGLVQAILTFCRNFDDEACSAVTTELGQWVVHNCEPHIWLVMTVDNAWHKGPAQADRLRACLRQLHQVASLLNGHVQNLLSKDVSGALARQAIADVLAEFGGRLSKRRGPECMNLHNPLSPGSALPMQKLPQPVFLGMQSLVSRTMVAQTWGGAPPVGLVLLHEHWLLWSTMAEPDTQSLYHYFRWVLLPGIRASASYFGSRFSQTRDNRMEQPLSSRVTWCQDSHGAQRLTVASGQDSLHDQQAALPSVWIQGTQEWCSLMVARVGEQLLMLLLPEGAAVTPETVGACLATTTPHLKRLNTSVAQYVQHVRRLHVPTFRYLFEDDQAGVAQASPGSKVATLGRQSLELAHSVKDAAVADGDWREVAVRGEADCWVVAKQGQQRRLVVVLEQQGLEGLQEACASADAFADDHFVGML